MTVPLVGEDQARQSGLQPDLDDGDRPGHVQGQVLGAGGQRVGRANLHLDLLRAHPG